MFRKKSDLMWPSMKLVGILHLKKNLRLNNVSIYLYLHQYWFIYECAKKKKAKIPEFFVRCRRTYVNDINKLVLTQPQIV